MKHAFLSGIAATAAALALGFAGPATADSTDLPVCNEASLWTVAETVVNDPFGTLWLTYECVPGGWLLVGATYCSSDGGCSSN